MGLPDAAAVAVGSVAIEAAAIDADALIEEEARFADVGASAIAQVLAVGALCLGNTSSGGSVDREAGDASCAAVDVA